MPSYKLLEIVYRGTVSITCTDIDALKWLIDEATRRWTIKGKPYWNFSNSVTIEFKGGWDPFWGILGILGQAEWQPFSVVSDKHETRYYFRKHE